MEPKQALSHDPVTKEVGIQKVEKEVHQKGGAQWAQCWDQNPFYMTLLWSLINCKSCRLQVLVWLEMEACEKARQVKYQREIKKKSK